MTLSRRGFIAAAAGVAALASSACVSRAPSRLKPARKPRAPGEVTRETRGEDDTEIHPLPPGITVEKDVRVTMRDGTRISINIFRPEGGGPVPVICACTKYDKDLRPEEYALGGRGDMFRSLGLHFGDLRVSEETPFEAPDPGYWVPHGYAVVHVDARGTGLSEGKADAIGEDTLEDFCEIVTWCSRQAWSNGKVGLNGVSYLAVVQWYIAARTPEGLAAIVPWEGFSDVYRDALFHGGIPETGFIPWWMGMGEVPGTDAPPEFSTDKPLSSRLPLPRPLSVALSINGGVAPLFERMGLALPELEKITVPALICASWSAQGLHSRGAFEAWRRIGSKEKWLYTHGGLEWTVSNSLEALDYQRAFYDCYLKGDTQAMAGKARVRLETRRTRDEASVRGEAEFPLPDTRYTPFFLEASRQALTLERPSHEAQAHYESTQDEELRFSFTFPEDTELTGHASLRLWVSTDAGRDMDVFVGLRKLDAQGREVPFINLLNTKDMLSRGWLRASHRKLDAARSTPWRPYLAHDEELPVEPGAVFPVDIELLPSSTHFEAGSSLVLVLKGRDIVPNRVNQHKKLFNAGRHHVHTGGARESFLLLPVIARPSASTRPRASRAGGPPPQRA